MAGKEYAIARYGMGDFWRRFLARRKPVRFVDGMTGSGAVAAFVAGLDLGIEVVANDAHPATPTLLRRVGEGWPPPDELSEERYHEIKALAQTTAAQCPACRAADNVCSGTIGNALPVHTCAASQDPVVGFAGFGVSFAGKYFAGYGGRPRPRYMRPVEGVAKVLRKAAPNLAKVRWLTGDYRTLVARLGGVKPGDLWYFDKPYTGTEQFRGVPGNGCQCGKCPPAKGAPVFCDTRFWQEMRGLSVDGADVLVSEFTAPAPWSPVWSVTRRQEMRDGHNAQAQDGRADSVYVLPHILTSLGGVL